jgi:hypothetical protein
MPLKIKRNPCRVNIIIPEYRIEGIIHLHSMMRFSDFMNAAPEFIPITDAKIFLVYDNKLNSEPNLIEVRRNQIIIIYPEAARSVLEEIDEIIEPEEAYPDKSMGSTYIDLTKKP